MRFSADWLQVTRVLTQYVAPGLVVLALVVELTGAHWLVVQLAGARERI